jgi:hypothetical protein
VLEKDLEVEEEEVEAEEEEVVEFKQFLKRDSNRTRDKLTVAAMKNQTIMSL